MMSNTAAVIGGGSWATALVKLLLPNLGHIYWYMRDTDAIDYIRENAHNPHYLRSVSLDTNKFTLTNDINVAVENADTIFLVIPSLYIRHSLSLLKTDLKGKTIVSAIKGMIPDENLIVSEYFNTYYDISYDNIAVLSGPCHSEEIAMEKSSFLTIASHSPEQYSSISTMLQADYVKHIFSKDITGIEYSATLKNIYAIAAGIAIGLGYGDNFLAVYASNAISELNQFLKSINSIERNTAYSVYTGDLLVTVYSQFSRNRLFGVMLGKGYSVESATMEMNMVAEGYHSTQSVYEKQREYNIEMPVITAVYNILYNETNPNTEIDALAQTFK